MTNYKYIFFDGSVILMKIWSIMRSNRFDEFPTKDTEGKLMFDDQGEPILHYRYNFHYEEIVKGFYWKVAKFLREIASARKAFIVFDWSPYHKIQLLPDYKGDRYHYTQEELDTLDPADDPVKYIQFQEEVRIEQLKFQAKKWICDHFSDLGFVVLTKKGYEADDWIYLISESLKDDADLSAIVSVDSDWTYFVKPNLDYLNFNGKQVKFADKKSELDEWVPEGLNLSLYQYKSYLDSLYGSHNNLKKTIKDIADEDFRSALSDIANGGTEFVTDRELFDAQLKSFDVDNYPEIDSVKEVITRLDSMGSILDVDQFSLYSTFTGMRGVTTSYYSKTVSRLDPTLYKEEVKLFTNNDTAVQAVPGVSEP